jgi:REP element-mobilizing transposase RayT
MPERLRRLELTFSESPLHFITVCTDQRRPLLASADIHSRLVNFGSTGIDRGARLGDYILMPDHLHAFVVIDPVRITLSVWVKSFKNALSKTLRDQNVAAPHWQKGFFDHVLRGQDSYSAKWHYVRNNPVRAGLVEEADDWPFAGRIDNLEFRRDCGD